MTARTQALVKDVAALFVKYSLADWSPLIEELEKGGRGKIAEAVGELAATPRAPARARPKAKPAKSVAKKPAKAVQPSAGTGFSPARAQFLEPLLRALKTRVVAPTAHDMRELYLAIGIKDAYPKRREEAVEAVILRLDQLPEPQFRKILTDIVGQDDEVARPADDYARWFNLILEPKR